MQSVGHTSPVNLDNLVLLPTVTKSSERHQPVYRMGMWSTRLSLRLDRTNYETILSDAVFFCLTVMGALCQQELQSLILRRVA